MTFRVRMPNSLLQQTGHATDGSSGSDGKLLFCLKSQLLRHYYLQLRPAGFEPATYGLGNAGNISANVDNSSISRTPDQSHSPQHSPAPANRCESVTTVDSALARIIDAWPALPEPIRRAMLALAESK